MSSLDSDQSGGISSDELQSFVDSLDDETRSALLSLQEDSSSSTDSTSSTSDTASSSDSSSTDSTSSTSSSDLVSQLMSELDTDGDGSISGDEMSSFMQASAPPPPPPPGGPQGADGTSQSASSSDSSSDSSTSTSSTSSTSTASSTDSSSSTDDTDTSSYSQMLAQLLMQSYGQMNTNAMLPPASSFDTAA